MLQTRIIPCLQLIDNSLVKTVKFSKFSYIGDPVNTVRIFNELEVDELVFLDIRASRESRQPNFELLREIADECFMPLAYGGGISDFETAKHILSIGFEKVVLNTSAYRKPALIKEISNYFGAQAVVVSIDIKKNIFGKSAHFINDGLEKTAKDPLVWAKEVEQLGAGELLLTSMDRDGTWSGFDVELTQRFTEALNIPVIANGGAGSIKDISEIVKVGHASAVALGSMVVYQTKGMGVLVSFPDKDVLKKEIN